MTCRRTPAAPVRVLRRSSVPVRRPSVAAMAVPGAGPSIEEVIARWQTRLLDLTRSNRLLYFKVGKSAVPITGRSSDELSQELSRTRKGLRFDYAERRVRRDNPFGEQGADESGRDDVTVVPGDLDADCAPLELQRRLKRLQKRDSEWEQEQGLNVLFLASGLLDWIDEEGEPVTSPLLLTSCNLERTSPRDHFRLLSDIGLGSELNDDIDAWPATETWPRRPECGNG